MSVFPADTAQVISSSQRSHAYYLPLTTASYSLIPGGGGVGVMRTVRGPPLWQPGAHLFPEGQERDPDAHGQCALRENGRK